MADDSARPAALPLHGCAAALLKDSGEGEEFMMGIDEAGRGPTLGPMIYGSAFCAVKDEVRLKAMGFADSKALSEARRDELWSQLQEAGFIGWRIRVLHAAEISEGMLRKDAKYNLNAMSHDAAIGLVRGVLDLGINLKHLFVDTVGDPERYQAKLQAIFPTVNVTVEKKADAKFPIVSAASICAKVPRDKILSTWRFAEPRMGSDYECAPMCRSWGCGYPSDKDTQRWMRDNMEPVFGWPDVVRFSWGPALEVMQKDPKRHGACEVRWEDDEESEEKRQQRGQMEAFVGLAAKKRKLERHQILTECMLEQVESW